MTLNQIVDDILLTCAYIDKEKTDKLLRRHVEAWVHQYRLLLMKQDISKNSVVDPTYITYYKYSFTDVGTEEADFLIGPDVIDTLVTKNIYKRGYFYISDQPIPQLAPLIGRVGIVSAQAYNMGPLGAEVHSGKETYSTPIHVCDLSRSFYGGYSRWNRNALNLSVYEDKLILFSYGKDPLEVIGTSQGLGQKLMYVWCGMVVANPDIDPKNTMGEDPVEFRDREYPMPDDRIPRLKQMIYANELQWVFPARDTAQSGQMAKLEEQELKNNPEHLLQAGADLYDGYD